MEIINAALDKEIILINNHIDKILQSDNKKMQEIFDWVLQSRGKQLRPKLVCLSSKFGKKKSDVTKIAAMLEIVHTASLIHDDIVDESETRRGYLSVQKKFGKHMAVYAGDYMIFCVVKEAVNSVDYKKYTKLYTVIQKMCNGELGQDSVLYKTDVTEEIYINNIMGKTAALFQAACELGAVTANAPNSVITALGEYGKNLGILFQIRDDLLDYTSNEKEIGKPVLQDFGRGIYTLPIIYSFENPISKQRMLELAEETKEKGLTTKSANEILDIVNQSQGIIKTRTKAKEFYDAALFSLSGLPDINERRCLEEILEKIYKNI